MRAYQHRLNQIIAIILDVENNPAQVENDPALIKDHPVLIEKIIQL